MEIPAGAWILVADGKKALLLRNDGEELYPNLHVIKKSVQENPATHVQGTDRPGSLASFRGWFFWVESRLKQASSINQNGLLHRFS